MKESRKYRCIYCGEEFERLDLLGIHARKCEKRKEALKKEEELEEKPAEEKIEEKLEEKLEKEEKPEEKFEEKPEISKSEIPTEKPEITPPFKKIPEPWEILEEILREHGLKEGFIRYAVSRCREREILHPTELYQMLQDLESGVKTKTQCRYIVEDYEIALMRAQEEAKRLGARFPIFYYRPAEMEYYPRYPLRPEWRETRETYPPPTFHSPSPPPPGDLRTAIREELKELIRERDIESRFDRLEHQRYEIETNLEKRLKELEDKLAEKFSTLAVPTTPPPDVITKDELLQILKDKEKDSYIKYLEKVNEDLVSSIRDMRKTWEEDRKEWTRKIEELSSRPPQIISSAGYSRDEYRLIADSLNILGQKTPIKDIGQIVVRLIPREKIAPELEKIGEEGITSQLPPEMVE